MDVEVPEGFKLEDVKLQAETPEAFDAVVEQRGLKVIDTGPHSLGDRIYTVAFADFEEDGVTYRLRSPERVHRLVDA